MNDRGILVQTVECTDPLARSCGKLLGMEGVALAILAISILFVLLSIKVGDGIPKFVYSLIFLSFPPLIAATFLLMSEHHHACTRPIRIYSHGLEAFSSLSYKLRGTDGFLSRAMLKSVELMDLGTGPLASKEGNTSIVVELKNGRKRMIGIRPRKVAREIAAILGFLWELPIRELTWAAP